MNDYGQTQIYISLPSLCSCPLIYTQDNIRHLQFICPYCDLLGFLSPNCIYWFKTSHKGE